MKTKDKQIIDVVEQQEPASLAQALTKPKPAVSPPLEELSPIVESRKARELAIIQSKMAIAKKFPRNIDESISRIKEACQRRSLAEVAVYEYPRGGQIIKGPSIRLAETIAQLYGNIHSWVDIEDRGSFSIVSVGAIDLETNVSKEVTFTVQHARKSRGMITELEDPRDIYEHVASQAARRLRSCILSLIPGDIIELAVDECEKTLQSQAAAEPLPKRIQKMVQAFMEIGVDPKKLEVYLQHPISEITERKLIQLRKIYLSIKDGFLKPEDIFKDQPQTQQVTNETE